MSTMSAAPAFKPWNQEDHERFMLALAETVKFASTDASRGTAGSVWDTMARLVGDRHVEEIKWHAQEVLTRFLGKEKHSGAVASQTKLLSDFLDAGEWTYEEDLAFENALINVEEGDPSRWEKIAMVLPGRSATDVRRRYEKYLLDIALARNGHQVRVTYRKLPGGLSLHHLPQMP